MRCDLYSYQEGVGLRPTVFSDARSLSLLHERCFDDPWSYSFFETLLFQRFTHGLKHEAGGCMKGFLMYSLVDEVADILTLCVDPLYRRDKIATSLMKHLMEVLSSQLVERIILEVSELNKSAIGLYEKFGFKKIRARPLYYGDGSDAYVMECCL